MHRGRADSYHNPRIPCGVIVNHPPIHTESVNDALVALYRLRDTGRVTLTPVSRLGRQMAVV